MLRKNFIIKPRLQLKYMLIALAVVCVTAVAVYFAFWSALIEAPGMEELSGADWKVLQHGYQVSFIWVVLILAAAIGIESIFFFHKLAGPLYVFEKTIRRLASGDLSVAVRLRRRDELKDMAAGLQEMIDAFKNAVVQDRSSVDEAQALLDKGEIAAAKEKLSSLTRFYTLSNEKIEEQ